MTTPPPPGGDQPPYDPNQPPPPPGGGQPPYDSGGQPPYDSGQGGGGYGYPPAPPGGYGSTPVGGGGSGSGTNGMAITSLVLGIAALLLSFCCLGVILGPAAIITGWMGMKKADQSQGQIGGRGLALAGLICGGIGLLISLVFVILALTTGDWSYNYGTDM